MAQAYISGALTGVANVEELKQFYEAIGALCSEWLFDVHIPHLYTDPVTHADVTPKEVYTTDRGFVLSSDLLVAYVGVPSLGVGMELAWADEYEIPTVLLYEKGATVSRLARGGRSIIALIEFESRASGLDKLRKTLTAHSELLGTSASMKTARTIWVHYRVAPSGESRLLVSNDSDQELHVLESENVIELVPALTALKEAGLTPEVVFIKPFPSIGDDIRAVWPDAKVNLDLKTT